MIGEDDDDDDDEEEDKVLTTVQPLEFLTMLIRQGVAIPNRIANLEQVLTFDASYNHFVLMFDLFTLAGGRCMKLIPFL